MTTIAELRELVADMVARDVESARRHTEWKAEFEAAMEKMRRDFDKEHKKTDAAIRKTHNEFHCKWSRFVEALCENQVVSLLQARGININYVTERQKGRMIPSGKQYELDITAVNSDTIVVVEVKTTLRPDDVKDFAETMSHAHEIFYREKNHRFLGGMAFLHEAAKAAQFAQKQGFFTIMATGEGAVITNEESFQPKEW